MKKVVSYIFCISIVLMISNNVSASVSATCSNVVNSDNYQTRTCHADYEDKSNTITFRRNKKDGTTQIKFCTGSYDENDITKTRYYGVCNGNLNLTLNRSLEKGTSGLESITLRNSGSDTDFEILGLEPYQGDIESTIICNGADYNIDVDTSKNKVCKIVIKNDSNGNVIMKYGDEATFYSTSKDYGAPEEIINPGKGPFTCNVGGDTTIFKLNNAMFKNTLKKVKDCPKIISSDKTQASNSYISSGTPKRADDVKNSNNSHLNDPGNDNINQGKLKCINLVNTKLNKYIIKIFSIMKYAGIVLCIGLTIYDFAKALLDSDKNALNKITKRALTRLVLVALLFFLPTLVNFLISIFVDNPCKINF